MVGDGVKGSPRTNPSGSSTVQDPIQTEAHGRTFRVALTGDFLDGSGKVALGDAGLPLLDEAPFVVYCFLRGQAPDPGDARYWERYYSLDVTADQVAGVNGLVVLRPRVT